MQSLIAQAANENFKVHASWVQSQTEGMLARLDAELLLSDSGLNCDTFNLIGCARMSTEQADDRIAAATTHFHDRERAFSWWLSPNDEPASLASLLSAHGLVRAETELAMSANLADLHSEPVVPPDLQIKRVSNRGELQNFANVLASMWNPPDKDVIRFYDLGAAAILSTGSPFWLYVGYLDGEPVATAEATIAGGAAGLYNIGTRTECRRRGFGTAMTLKPLWDARAVGLELSVLQASDDGAGIYKRVGFKTFGEISEFKLTGE